MTTTVDLVLEGGGVKGLALVGAIAALEERGYRFARVAGTSAGAIVGALVAAGASGEALHDAMSSIDYRRFRDASALGRVPLLGHGLSLVHEHGLYAGEYLHNFIAGRLAERGVRTFADLVQRDPGADLSGQFGYRLLVMASDVSRGRLLRLPWDYHCVGLDPEEQLVADAVRASVSLPFFFRPVNLEVPGAPPSVLLDGGLLSNFPVDAFDRTDGKPARWPTIGVKLLARRPPGELHHHVDGDLSLAVAMFETMMSWHDELRLADPAVAARTVFVDTFGVKATDFDIDPATQQRLYDSGRAAAIAFLDDTACTVGPQAADRSSPALGVDPVG